MNEATNELRVQISKIIAAPVEEVFDAWLDPATLARFILPMPGMNAPDVENDPREGGTFNIVMHVGDHQIPHTGTYYEIDRPHKLVFSWVSPASTEDSRVTLNFTSLSEGQTNVELTQVKFLDEGKRADHEGGWTNILSELSGLFG